MPVYRKQQVRACVLAWPPPPRPPATAGPVRHGFRACASRCISTRRRSTLHCSGVDGDDEADSGVHEEGNVQMAPDSAAVSSTMRGCKLYRTFRDALRSTFHDAERAWKDSARLLALYTAADARTTLRRT